MDFLNLLDRAPTTKPHKTIRALEITGHIARSFFNPTPRAMSFFVGVRMVGIRAGFSKTDNLGMVGLKGGKRVFWVAEKPRTASSISRSLSILCSVLLVPGCCAKILAFSCFFSEERTGVRPPRPGGETASKNAGFSPFRTWILPYWQS